MLKIYVCDCTYFMKSEIDKGTKANLVLTDPHSTYDKTFNIKWLKLAYKLLDADGILCTFCSPPTRKEFIDQMMEVGFKYGCTFYRFNHRASKSEPCIVAYKGNVKPKQFKLTLKDCSKYDMEATVGGFPTEAQKPLTLIKNLVRAYSKPHDLVIDPFVGSGTTALACKQTGRDFMGCEKKMEYARVAKKRLGFHDIYQTGI